MEQHSPPTQVFKIRLPMRIQSSKKKKTALNLNVYRNLHFRSLTAQKKNFSKIAKKLLSGVPQLGRITLHYDIHPATRRRLDIGNVGSIVDKYFSDSLTECGIIEDDSYEYLDFVSFGFGGIAKEEYVLVTITEIEPKKENDMRILLDQNDLQTACDNHLESLGITGATGVHLSVDDGEIIAEVLFGDGAETASTPATKPKKNRGGRPAGSKNKPKAKEPEADVEKTDAASVDSSSGGDSKTSEEKTPDTTSSDDESAKSAAGKKSKNLFEESPEASSEASDPVPEESDSDSKPKQTVKKSSIFDQD